MQDGPLHVDVIGLSAGHDPQHQNVYQQSKHGDDHHRAGKDGGRSLQSLPCFIGDPCHDHKERHSVQEAGDDLEPKVAKGALAVSWSAPEPECRVCQSQRCCIGQHVARIGQKGQRARQHAADSLHDHEAEDQEEGQQDLAFVSAGHFWSVVMVVTMFIVRLGHQGLAQKLGG